MPIYYGYRAIGGLFGNFFGGRIIKAFTNQTAFLISAIFHFFTLFVVVGYNEKKIVCPKEQHFKKEMKQIFGLLTRKSTLHFVVFVFLINLTPNFDSLVTFYLTDNLKFNTADLADFATVSGICYIIGLFSYYTYFKNFKPSSFYLATNFLYWLSNIIFLLVVFNIVQKLNIDLKIFCSFTQGLSALM